jgi:hypothetical protein
LAIERAVRNIAAATASFDDLNDAKKVGALIKPHVAAVEDTVKAASGIAEVDKKGGMSFGSKLGSPEPGPGEQSIPRGRPRYSRVQLLVRAQFTECSARRQSIQPEQFQDYDDDHDDSDYIKDVVAHAL